MVILPEKNYANVFDLFPTYFKDEINQKWKYVMHDYTATPTAFELSGSGVVMPKFGRALQVPNNRVKRAIGALR